MISAWVSLLKDKSILFSIPDELYVKVPKQNVFAFTRKYRKVRCFGAFFFENYCFLLFSFSLSIKDLICSFIAWRRK